MKLPAITNAILSRVQAAGFTDDYDQVATVGADKWTGSERIYFQQETERVPRAGESDVIVGRSLVVSADVPVTFQIGDVATVTPDDDAEVALTVRRVARTVAPGLAGVVRLAVEDG